MSGVIVVATALLCLAAVLTFVRLVRGPSVLDRVVAMDMLLALIVCGLGSMAAHTHDSTVVPVVLVVALLGFIGSVSIARFVGKDDR